MNQIPKEVLIAIESVNIPSIPKVMLNVLRLVEEDKISMIDLAEQIGRDPALSLRVFSIANSPAFRQISENKNLVQCLSVIGISLLRTITACLAIQSVFSRNENEFKYDYSGFWKHSLLVAEIARELAFKINYKDIEEVYLSALLHDVGQLLLLGGLGEKYGVVLNKCSDEISLMEMEEPLFGTDHAAIGAWQINQWNFSSFMADAIRFHHCHFKEIAIAGQLIQIVWSAHVIAANNLHVSENSEQQSDMPAIMSMLELDSTDLDTVLRHSSERVTLLAEELGISRTEIKSIPQLKFRETSRTTTNQMCTIPEKAEIELMVRDMAMMYPLQQNLSTLGSETEILFSLREAARILFNLHSPVIYLVQNDRQVLAAADIKGQPELLRHLEIKIEHETSLAAVAVSGKQICSTDDVHNSNLVSLIDLQIARILNTKDLMYIPMYNRNNCLGLMIFGINSDNRPRIQTQLGWINSFAHVAAISMESWRESELIKRNRDRAGQYIFDQQNREAIHEACNPLGIIKNYLKIIYKELPEAQGIQQNLNIISEEIDRVTQIIRGMDNKSSTPETCNKLNLNELVDEMLSIYGAQLFTNKGILIEKYFDQQLEPVFIEKNIVKQILLNLWKNSSEAMQNNGRFSIYTRNSLIHNGSDYVEIQISDTGPGLPDDVIQNIFQPLPANRTPEHSGLGLSIVSSLINFIHGHITFQSRAEVGTTFSILLPR